MHDLAPRMADSITACRYRVLARGEKSLESPDDPTTRRQGVTRRLDVIQRRDLDSTTGRDLTLAKPMIYIGRRQVRRVVGWFWKVFPGDAD